MTTMKMPSAIESIRMRFWRIASAALTVLVAGLLPAYAETISYYHNDFLGSPLAITDQSGAVKWRQAYTPHGERLPDDVKSNKIWFTSRAQDDFTGLVYMGARWYDPETGRFVSMDPVGFTESNPYSFNRYSYANNNPYRFVDPAGTNAVTAFGGLLQESANWLSGSGFNGTRVLGALRDGYDGEGSGFASATFEDVTTFVPGGLVAGGLARAYRFGKTASIGPVIIGETMLRVEQAAAKIPGAKILDDMPDFEALGMNVRHQIESARMQYNRKWILEQLRSGRQIIDIGRDVNRSRPSIFYEMERNMIKNYEKLHPDYKNVSRL